MTKLEGVVVPVITPVNAEGCVDEKAFRAVLRRCMDGGVHGLFVCGTSGMGPLLPDGEWRRAAEVAQDEVKGRLPLLAGVMETSTPRSIQRIRILESLGYRYFVLTATYFVPLSQHEAFMAHFGTCRQATSMEMVVYNIPPCVGSCIPADTLMEMARRGWTRYCKDSSGSREYFAEICRRGKELGLGVFQGNRPDFAWLASLGAVGVVPVPGNIEPHTLSKAWNAVKAGDLKTAQAMQPHIDTLWSTLVEGFDFLSGNIYCLEKLGIGAGHLIAPHQQASAARKQVIDEYIQKNGLK